MPSPHLQPSLGDVQLCVWPSRVKSSLEAGGITLGTSALPGDQQLSQEPTPIPAHSGSSWVYGGEIPNVSI